MVVEEQKVKKEIENPSKSGQLYLLSALAKEASFLEELASKLTEMGMIIEHKEDLGEKNLHFPIKKERKLRLISIFFSCEREELAKIDQYLKHDEPIARYLLTQWNAPIPKETNRTYRRKEENV